MHFLRRGNWIFHLENGKMAPRAVKLQSIKLIDKQRMIDKQHQLWCIKNNVINCLPSISLRALLVYLRQRCFQLKNNNFEAWMCQSVLTSTWGIYLSLFLESRDFLNNSKSFFSRAFSQTSLPHRPNWNSLKLFCLLVARKWKRFPYISLLFEVKSGKSDSTIVFTFLSTCRFSKNNKIGMANANVQCIEYWMKASIGLLSLVGAFYHIF